jgi:hypothetical protein
MEGTSGAAVGTVPNAITGAGAAPAATQTGASFNYSSTVVAPFIYDPVSGTTVSNKSSFAYTGGTTAGYLRVLYTDPGEAVFDVPDYTIEMFVRVNSVVSPNANFVSHGSGTSATTGWKLRSLSLTYNIPSFTIVSENVYSNILANKIDDGAWHHLAFVVKTSADGGGNFAKLYLDHTLIATKTTGLDSYVASIGSSFLIYAAGYTGFADEVRFSDTPLAPSQFLQPSQTL